MKPDPHTRRRVQRARWYGAVVAIAMLVAGPAAAQPAKGSPDHIRAATKVVDGTAIRNNAKRGADWPSHRLDYAETRFSRLAQVNADNVKQLGLVWSYNLE